MCKSKSKDYLCVVSKSSRVEKTIDKETLEVTEGKRKALVSLATDRTFQQKR